jgi:SAM-dependent methyltransferase
MANKEAIVNRHSKDKTLLDIGCGTGEFIAHLQRKNWKVDGVEPSPEANRKATKKTNHHIHHALSEINDQQYSIITLWHVLEHIHEPHSLLSRARLLLKSNGKIVIAVPNRNAYDAIYYQNHWAGYDVPRHLWHFTRKDMEQLLTRNRLTTKYILPMKLDAYYVSMLSEQYKNPKASKYTNYINALILGWKSNHSAKRTGEYSSLIYIAERE